MYNFFPSLCSFSLPFNVLIQLILKHFKYLTVSILLGIFQHYAFISSALLDWAFKMLVLKTSFKALIPSLCWFWFVFFSCDILHLTWTVRLTGTNRPKLAWKENKDSLCHTICFLPSNWRVCLVQDKTCTEDDLQKQTKHTALANRYNCFYNMYNMTG